MSPDGKTFAFFIDPLVMKDYVWLDADTLATLPKAGVETVVAIETPVWGQQTTWTAPVSVWLKSAVMGERPFYGETRKLGLWACSREDLGDERIE